MNSSTSSESAAEENPKYRKQKFSYKWLDDDCFKGWLEDVSDDPFKCKCSACNKILNCGKSDLLKHADTKAHKKNVKSLQKTNKIDNFFKKKSCGSVEKAKQMFEIKLSMFFAEHNVALQVVDHLVPLLKEIVPDSNIIKSVELGRQKCTNIIKNVIAKVEKENLVNKLKTTKFSVMIDESTDVSMSKQMCILVRFFDEKNDRAVVKLLDLLPIGIECTAEAIYKAFKECILSLGIPFDNIIGMCSDGANVMMGKFNSFASRLTGDLPNAIVIKCLCHSAAIVASKACLELPRAPEDLLRQIGCYVSGSSKRCAQLEAIQEALNEKKKKVLRTCTTRWLSHQKCIESVLDNWVVLLEFFKQAFKQDKLKSTERIFLDLNNECIKAYLLFLKYVLNYFNSLNALFQSKAPLIHIIQRESVKIFLSLGQNFIKKSELSITCNVRSPHVSLPLEEVFLGYECKELLKTIPKEAANQIRMDCLKFYIVALEEIQQRLPLKAEIFKELEFLNPQIALAKTGSKNEISFKNILRIVNVDTNNFLQEWRTFEFNFSDEEINNFLKMDIEKFWGKVTKMKNFNDNLMFPLLSKIATFALSLPHANADSERIFSIITDVRTKKRNKLSHKNLTSICIIRSYLQDELKNCYNFQCTEMHLRKMTSQLYDHCEVANQN